MTSIARQYKCSVSQVNRIIRHYRATNTVESTHRTFSPQKLTSAHLEQLDHLIQNKKGSTSKYLASELHKTKVYNSVIVRFVVPVVLLILPLVSVDIVFLSRDLKSQQDLSMQSIIIKMILKSGYSRMRQPYTY